MVVEVVDIHHFSRFCNKNGRFFLKNEANLPTRMDRLQPIIATFCAPMVPERRSDAAGMAFRGCRNGVPGLLEWRSGAAGTAFRRPWNGRKVHSEEQEVRSSGQPALQGKD